MSSPAPSKNSKPKPGTRPVGFRAHKSPAANDASNQNQPSVSPLAGSIPNSNSAPAARPPIPTPIATSSRNAPPLKKRAKGSGFLSVLFLSAFFAAGYFVWSSLLQYQAFGVVEGRIIAVSAPWDGTVSNWQVRDGELVSHGQILAQIANIDMEHELAALGDELKMSQATLDAEMSKVKFEVQNQSERSQIAVAEYLKSYGELLAEQAKLSELDRKFERTKKLAKSSNVSQSEYEKIYFQLAGQRNKIEKLEDAVDVLKMRSTDSNLAENDGSSRLKPILAEIELTQAKMARLRVRIDQGQIKSPVSGRVSKRHRLTGESTRVGETVIDILEDNSVEAVLYVPQKLVDEFEIGKEVDVVLEPNKQPMRCTIKRFGDRFGPAPTSIERFYKVNQPLLPVYLTPNQDANQIMSMRIGGTVKRPYDYGNAFNNMIGDWKAYANQFRSGESRRSAPSTNQNVSTKKQRELSGDDKVAAGTFETETTERTEVRCEPIKTRSSVKKHQDASSVPAI